MNRNPSRVRPRHIRCWILRWILVLHQPSIRSLFPDHDLLFELSQLHGRGRAPTQESGGFKPPGSSPGCPACSPAALPRQDCAASNTTARLASWPQRFSQSSIRGVVSNGRKAGAVVSRSARVFVQLQPAASAQASRFGPRKKPSPGKSACRKSQSLPDDGQSGN
jgi:hypothetical protein